MQGLAECVRRLEDLPHKIQKRVMRKAIRAGGYPLVRAARKAAPRGAGILAKSLEQKIVSYQGGRVVVTIVGQRKSYRTEIRRRGHGGLSRKGYAVPIHLVELSTRPHRIPKSDFRAVQLKTTKAYRDRMRALGREFRVYAMQRRKPLVLRLPSGQQVLVTSIEHPGTRGSNFMRTAAQQAADAAADAFAAKMAVETDREILALKVLGWKEGY